jgi:hypothetical protein
VAGDLFGGGAVRGRAVQRVVAGRLAAAVAAHGVEGAVAGGGEEVRLEGVAVLEPAGLDRLQDAGECLGHRVGGVVGVAGDGLADAPGGVGVTPVELVERIVEPGEDPVHQHCIGQHRRSSAPGTSFTSCEGRTTFRWRFPRFLSRSVAI